MKGGRSKRKGARGHWPRGKRRSDLDEKTRRQLIARIRVACDRGLSLKAIAEAIRVSDRAVRRWLAGDHYPMKRSVRRMNALPRVTIR